MSSTTLQVTLLASEWNSSKGGLSTMNRELATELARHPNVSVTFFVPKCTEDDKKQANSRNITIVEARERPGFDPIDWLSFPPRDLVIDIIIGHGVKLGKQAQVIMEYRHCKWMQVVHTVPEELAMFKTYSGAISKGDEKQWTEVKLCKIADLVVAVGSKLCEVYSRYLSSSGKTVFNLTPSIFTELSNLKPSTEGSKKFWVLVFGRGDSEDFELKGFDIAAKAVAELNDRSYHLIFVGAPSGNETQVAEKLLDQGISRSQLTVKGYLENREDLATLLSTANLAIIPSRTEGFGLTALEALSAGLPFLVSQNSGFGEALHEIPSGSSWIVDSEDPEQWAEAIKAVREKGRERALRECQELRTHYAEKYSWEEQCNALVERMLTLVRESEVEPKAVAPLQNRSQSRNTSSGGERRHVFSDQSLDHLAEVLKDRIQMTRLDPASKPGKRVDDKSGQPSTLTSPLQRAQSVTEQRIVYGSPLQKSQSVPEERTAYGSPLQKAQSVDEQLRTAYGSPLQKAQSVNEQRTAYESLLLKFQSMDEQSKAHGSPVQKAQSVDEQRTAYGSPLQKSQSVTEQRTAYGSLQKAQSVNEQLRTAYGSALQTDQFVGEQKTTYGSALQKSQSVPEQRAAYRGPLQRNQFVNEQKPADGSPLQKSQSVPEQRAAYRGPLQRDQFADEQLRTAYGSPLQRNQFVNEQKSQSVPEQRAAYGSPLQRDQFVDEQLKTAYGPLQRDQFVDEQLRTAFGSPLQKSQSVIEQRTAYRGPLQKSQSVPEQRTADSLFSPFNSGQGARPHKVPLSSTDMAILGCSVSKDSMHAARKALQAIAPKLKLSQSPPVVNLPPEEAKWYLMRNKLKFCMLVVDAVAFKDAYESVSKRRVEYEALLETAADRVEVKVIILLSCDTCYLTPKDEAIVNETIERITNKTGKGFTAWLKRGRLTVDPDVLVQVMNSKSTVSQRNPQTSFSGGGDFQTSTKQPQGAWATHQPSYSPADTEESTVMLMSKLRNGRISYMPDDLEKLYPGFTVPHSINQSLLHEHYNTSVTGVKIVKDQNGELGWSVEPTTKDFSRDKGMQIAANETLVLKTRLYYGKVSWEKGDLEFIYPNWQIPPYILNSLLREYQTMPNGELNVISDEQGNLRYKVHTVTELNIHDFAGKAWKGLLKFITK